MFSRRGYNIDSLSVGVTENPKYSRMTVAASGDDLTLAQIAKQLNKLEDVVEIIELKDGESVCRELVLVKVKTNREEKQQIIALTDVFRAKIVDVSVEDYSDGNYSMTDLKTFITDEITAYNDKNGENCVVMNRLDTDNNVGKLQLTYSGMKDYNGFNHTDYELAELSDTTISGSFISAADGSSVAAADIQEAGLQVLKVCDAMNIISKKKVLYYNSFVTEQDGTYIISGEGDAVLILK